MEMNGSMVSGFELDMHSAAFVRFDKSLLKRRVADYAKVVEELDSINERTSMA